MRISDWSSDVCSSDLPPGRDHYGRLSVAAQWRCEVRMLFDIGPKAVVPAPKVTSTVVELQPRPAPLAEADPKKLERMTAAAFGQRRKMLRAALKPLWPEDRKSTRLNSSH